MYVLIYMIYIYIYYMHACRGIDGCCGGPKLYNDETKKWRNPLQQFFLGSSGTKAAAGMMEKTDHSGPEVMGAPHPMP